MCHLKAWQRGQLILNLPQPDMHSRMFFVIRVQKINDADNQASSERGSRCSQTNPASTCKPARDVANAILDVGWGQSVGKVIGTAGCGQNRACREEKGPVSNLDKKSL